MTPAQWAGQLAHRAVEGVLRARTGGAQPDLEAHLADTLRRARAAIADARAGLPRVDPRRYVGFEVLAYGPDPGDAWWEDVLERVRAATAGLFAHGLLRRLLEVPDRVVDVERLARFRVNDVRAVVAMDVLVADGRGGLVVVDWKTGAHHDAEVVDRQLATYALAVGRLRGLGPERVVGVQADARTGAHRTVRFDAATIERTRRDVVAGARSMAALLPDPTRDVLDGFALPQLPEGDPRCGTCRFRRLCER